MESKALKSVLKTDVTEKPVNDMQSEDRRKKLKEGYGIKEVGMRKYGAISKNGDTLELSESGKELGRHPHVDVRSLSGKKIISDSGDKMPDNVLAGCSKARLKQLYANKEITRQQYEHIMKMKKG